MSSAREIQARRKRTLIRPLHQAVQKDIKNIFVMPKWNPEESQPKELHHIVGDNDWKKTAYGNLLHKKQPIQLKESREEVKSIKSSIKQPSIIHNTFQNSMNNTRQSKFCLDQIDKDTRQQRVLEKYSKTQAIWKEEQKGILSQVKRNKSISYNAVKHLYLHPNPDKMSLINDNVPEYWQHSLRDNCKILKKHIRNNPFKKEVAEQMLMTLAGRKKIEQSIPQLQTIQQNLSLKGKRTKLKSISIKPVPLSFDETYKADYAFKDKWLNQISFIQTKSSAFTIC